MKVKDPVCGMMVDEETAPAKSERNGKTYYLCSLECKEIFDADAMRGMARGEESPPLCGPLSTKRQSGH